LENEIKITGKEVIKGTPVCVGRLVARVYVAHNLDEAVNIQVFICVLNMILLK
jgi:hypothetical protein